MVLPIPRPRLLFENTQYAYQTCINKYIQYTHIQYTQYWRAWLIALSKLTTRVVIAPEQEVRHYIAQSWTNNLRNFGIFKIITCTGKQWTPGFFSFLPPTKSLGMRLSTLIFSLDKDKVTVSWDFCYLESYGESWLLGCLEMRSNHHLHWVTATNAGTFPFLLCVLWPPTLLNNLRDYFFYIFWTTLM